jgi:hypothetical protein
VRFRNDVPTAPTGVFIQAWALCVPDAAP